MWWALYVAPHILGDTLVMLLFVCVSSVGFFNSRKNERGSIWPFFLQWCSTPRRGNLDSWAKTNSKRTRSPSTPRRCWGAISGLRTKRKSSKNATSAIRRALDSLPPVWRTRWEQGVTGYRYRCGIWNRCFTLASQRTGASILQFTSRPFPLWLIVPLTLWALAPPKNFFNPPKFFYLTLWTCQASFLQLLYFNFVPIISCRRFKIAFSFTIRRKRARTTSSLYGDTQRGKERPVVDSGHRRW